MKARALVVLAGLVLFVGVSVASADIPPLINYQGILTDTGGMPLDGPYDLTFSLYADSSGGVALWTEVHPAEEVDDGLFNVILGEITPFGDIGDQAELWMGITIDADPEISPRMQLTSVPYAFEAAMADSADGVRWTHIAGMPAGFADGVDDVGGGGGWVDNSSWVTLENDNDYVGIGTSAPTAKLDVRGKVSVGDTVPGQSYDVNFHGWSGPYSGFYWNGSQLALRTGRDTDGSHWGPGTIGDYSFATGYNTRAAGGSAAALGSWSSASGTQAFAAGYRAAADGSRAVAMGFYAEALGDNSIALGDFVFAKGTNSIVMGSGIAYSDSLINNFSDALIVGFDGDPMLFVGGPDDRVGVGTVIPSQKLDVAGTAEMDGFKMPTGASPGYVLTSDASGVGTWQSMGTAVADSDWTISGVNMYSAVLGNVGIGTAVPSAKLDVYGDVRVGAPGAGFPVTFYGDGIAGNKVYWDDVKVALRAGRDSDGMHWAPDSIGYYSFAAGYEVLASGVSSVSLGSHNNSRGDQSVTLGQLNTAQGREAIAMGSQNQANGLYCFAAGRLNTAQGNGSTAIGYGVRADAIYSTALGYYTDVNGKYGTATGYQSEAHGDYSTAMGYQTEASGDTATAMGENTTASGKASTAMGSNSVASGHHSTAMGRGTTASGQASTAMGSNSVASGNFSAAIGVADTADGYASRALGFRARSYGGYSTAMGSYTGAYGLGSVAIGSYLAAGPSDYCIVIGRGVSSLARLANNTQNSLVVGFNTTSPTLFVGGTYHRVGIGTASPTKKLEVAGEARVASSGNTKALDVYSTAFSSGEMVNLYTTQHVSSSWDMFEIHVGDTSSNIMQFIECERGTDTKFRVNGDGSVYADGSFTGPADFSEMIAVSSGAYSVEPGDVVVIDASGRREVIQSSSARSTLVAGIYSTKPGFVGSERNWDVPSTDDETGTHSLKSMAAEFDEVPVAVVGIVPCKVSAENGAIGAGDLLVTSDTPGHAMRDDDPKQGTVLGKALEPLSSGTGVVKVLVTLQ
jgi:hypothetical protein